MRFAIMGAEKRAAHIKNVADIIAGVVIGGLMEIVITAKMLNAARLQKITEIVLENSFLAKSISGKAHSFQEPEPVVRPPQDDFS